MKPTDSPVPSSGIVLRIFAYVVVVLSVGAGIGCIMLARPWRAMFLDLEHAALPSLIAKFLGTSGLFPGGIFLGLAVLIAAATFVGLQRTPTILAAISLLLIILTAVVLPNLLIATMARIIQTAGKPETDLTHSPLTNDQ